MKRAEWIAIVAIAVSVVTGFKSEIIGWLHPYWTGLTPWRFAFVCSLLYLVGYAVNRFVVQPWKRRFSLMEQSMWQIRDDMAGRIDKLEAQK